MSMQLVGAWWVLPLVGIMLAVSAVLIVTRLLKGPSGPDRVVSIDALTLLGVAAVATASLITRQAVLLDVAVILALVSFLSTAGFTLLFRKDDDVVPGSTPDSSTDAGKREDGR